MAVDRRDPTRPNTSGHYRRKDDPQFLTPGELCDRWRIDYKTLAKFTLPWVVLSDRVRRIELAIVIEFETRNRLQASSS